MIQKNEMSFTELSSLFSSLSKASEKQLRTEESALFKQLADYYLPKSEFIEGAKFSDLAEQIRQDLNSGFADARNEAEMNKDRGALRALTWGEKVTKILNSLITRYDKQQNALLEQTSIHVCEICGFVYIGDDAPSICPVCKVPNTKINPVQREVV